jgi:glycine hydroxymethyltransferase
VTNRNSIPADQNGAWYTSGVRLGTPALTTLGLGVSEFDEVAELIMVALRATEPLTANAKRSQARYTIPADTTAQCRSRCADLLERFPLYPTIEL